MTIDVFFVLEIVTLYWRIIEGAFQHFACVFYKSIYPQRPCNAAVDDSIDSALKKNCIFIYRFVHSITAENDYIV